MIFRRKRKQQPPTVAVYVTNWEAGTIRVDSPPVRRVVHAVMQEQARDMRRWQ